ncbi:TetR/AcrR family transcriptional regulator [Promicromonospora sp. Populi]|uniref:TetR/AcrR family transcriptional regulator n=1 Tax=Promicromonospora sp. Populi TaxID=3239420 RepID=UPI0034E2C250
MPEKTETRRGRPGYDQQAILEVAVAVFNEHGYEATSMGMLAERLGLSKAAIYHHISSKEQLLALALDHALDSLESVLDDSRDQGDAVARLSFLLRGAVHVLVRELPSVTLLLRLRGNSEVERAALARRRTFDKAVTQMVVEAQRDGSIRSDIAPGVAERLLFGMVNSIAEWYSPEGAEAADRLATDLLTVAFDGLRAAPETPST